MLRAASLADALAKVIDSRFKAGRGDAPWESKLDCLD
jgi:hypothetical protein